MKLYTKLIVSALLLSFFYGGYCVAQTLDENGQPRGIPINEAGKEKYSAGWKLQFDNDLLILGSDRDQDYTGGFNFTTSGRRAQESWWSLNPLLRGIDRLAGRNFQQRADNYVLHSAQIGLQVFSPSDIGEDSAIYDDRPFANLVYLANSRRLVTSPTDPVYQSTLTLGLLGTQFGASIQNAIHRVVGSEQPRGWDHQISDGGELTAQYALSRQSLLSSNFQKSDKEYELKYDLGMSLGYISELSTSLSYRWGHINTPWWSFTPESSNYASLPAPVVGDAVRKNTRELFFLSGVKFRARAYNAFLQGQFRDSEVTFDASELNPLIAEAWVGIGTQFSEFRVSYIIRTQTKEIKEGVGERNPIWGSLIVSRDF